LKTGGGSGVGGGTYPGCACVFSIRTQAPNTTAQPAAKNCASAIRPNLLVGIAITIKHRTSERGREASAFQPIMLG
jgi:hypothetical protein